MPAMRAAWTAVGGYYSQPGLMTVVNGMAILYSVPLIALAVIPVTILGHIAFAPLTMALLLGVVPNPAGAGLHFCARECARDETITVGDFHRGLARYWKPASVLFGVSLTALLIIAGNIAFYASLNAPIFFFLDLIWIYLFFTWLVAQFYLYPMLFTVDRPSIPLIYRNALVIAVRRPAATLFALILWVALLVLTCATGLVLVLGLIVPAIMQHALLARLLPTISKSTEIGVRP